LGKRTYPRLRLSKISSPGVPAAVDQQANPMR
jgi:hypothetical protein